jgi:small subunit ribosomal protein S21
MLKVKVKGKNIERALKQYKSKIIKTRQMREINKRREHLKDSEKRRQEISKAKYKQKKRREDEY